MEDGREGLVGTGREASYGDKPVQSDKGRVCGRRGRQWALETCGLETGWKWDGRSLDMDIDCVPG